VGYHRPHIPLLRHLATDYQYRDDDHHVSDGVHYPKHPAAVQAKLDELIRVSAAQNALIGIEHLTQDEISDIADKCLARAKKAGNGMQRSANKKAQAAISKTV
jgi:hypothetical protein